MIHPLLLAYARAKRAEHLAAVEHAPTGVASPAMTTHRAYAAWAAAGFPVEADVSAHPVVTVERDFGPIHFVTTGRIG